MKRCLHHFRGEKWSYKIWGVEFLLPQWLFWLQFGGGGGEGEEKNKEALEKPPSFGELLSDTDAAHG